MSEEAVQKWMARVMANKPDPETPSSMREWAQRWRGVEYNLFSQHAPQWSALRVANDRIGLWDDKFDHWWERTLFAFMNTFDTLGSFLEGVFHPPKDKWQ